MSGACYANGLTGKPPGQPGLAEYYEERGGVCAKKTSFFADTPLNLSEGYGLCIGFSCLFASITMFLVFLDTRYAGTVKTSEFFNTAGRGIKTGLTASVIVSQWTWAATLLQSSNVAWNYGVSGPFWYAAGATIQVLLFGVLAIQVKRFAYTAHTICEIIDVRWGPTAHKTFIYFCFMTNIIVSAMLVLGGAATVEALTGMDARIAGFIIPIFVVPYTFAGGLKATFMASYIHTCIIFVVLLTFVMTVYMTDSDLGSADSVYDRLQAVAHPERKCTTNYDGFGSIVVNSGQNCGPIRNNNGGSYLTMASRGGVLFGIINIVGNFGTVFVDQSYWQSAIAAKPQSAHRGYLYGGLVWFTIPFALATALGLSCVALDLPVTSGEAGSGLVPPAAAVHFYGKGGAWAVSLMLFMAITSTGSAEQIAVSSIIAYDIYKKYLNPAATGEQILFVSRIGICFFGVFMGFLSWMLLEFVKENDKTQYAGCFHLGFVYQMMGTFIGSAVVPIWYSIMWSKANAMGAIVGAFAGQVGAIIAWVVSAQILFTTGTEGSLRDKGVNTCSLLDLDTNLSGNLVAILFSGLIHTVWSMASPQNFDFDTMAGKIELVDDKLPEYDDPADRDQEELIRAKAWIEKWGYSWTFAMVVAWPAIALLSGSGNSPTVFSKGYFNLWVTIAVTWSIVATIYIVIAPALESWDQISNVVYALWGDDLVQMRLDDVEKKLDLLLESAGKKPDKPVWMTEGVSEDVAFRCKMINRGTLRAKLTEEAKYASK